MEAIDQSIGRHKKHGFYLSISHASRLTSDAFEDDVVLLGQYCMNGQGDKYSHLGTYLIIDRENYRWNNKS